jgi:hypothetical protein
LERIAGITLRKPNWVEAVVWKGEEELPATRDGLAATKKKTAAKISGARQGMIRNKQQIKN